MSHLSLRVRLGLAAGAAVAIAVIAVAISAYAGTRSQLLGQIDNSLRGLAAPIVDHSHGGGPGGGPPGGYDQQQGDQSLFQGGDCDAGLGIDLQTPPGYGAAPGVREFISRSGRVCENGGTGGLPVDAQTKAIAASTQGEHFRNVDVSGHNLRMLVVGIPGRGALAVALPLSDINHTLRNQLLLLAVIAAAGIALAALLGFLVAKTALAPIARFTRQTEKIAANPDVIDHERLDETGGDELERLARAFNETLDALERSVQSQRNLVADASHELRTPIATIRANLQLMRDEALLSPADREALRVDVIEELDELTALVGDVVELARGSKPSTEPGDVRVDAIVSAAVERTRRRAPELTVADSVEPTLVRGEGDRVARAVANLLDNAAKWSPPGGTIEVTLRDGTLSVRDHGPGFHEEDLPFVFDRFHRARDARSKPGSGLGLAIVRQAAEAHGGFVAASNAPGGGALLRLGFGPRLELEETAPEEVTAN
jgi:two-component system sensor histidine kinase MprB